MDERQPSEPGGDELKAIEARSAGASDSTTCPNCGRAVEAGFKFCDYCGTKLEAGPSSLAAPGAPASPKKDRSSRIDRFRKGLRRRRDTDDAASALAAGMKSPEEAPPLLPLDDITPPPAGSSAAEVTKPRSELPKVEDLRAGAAQGRAGISGRLRWREDEEKRSRAATASTQRVSTTDTTTWRPVRSADGAPRGFGGRDGVLFVFHLIAAFLVGAVLVGVAAVVASLTSDGRVALLEVRGLPIFIAGATAIIMFALLRTGPRRGLSARAVAISVLIGFVVLVTGVAFAYQPSLMRDAQSTLDRALGVFGDDVIEGIDRFEADVDQWNAEVHQYSEVELAKLSKARDTETDAAKLARAEQTFSVNASGSEEALDGILKRMRSHADGIEHAPLRDALLDLTGIFADELSGIHLITRGFVNDDQVLIQSGDTRFKDATQRAVEFFDDRIRPILERGDIDADSLGLAVEDLRG